MLNTLSKTVAIASIMCSVLFAQNSTDKFSVKDSVSKDSIQNQIKDSVQAQANLSPAISVLDTKDTTQKKDSTKQETAIPAAVVPAAIVPATALIPAPTPMPAPAEDPEKQAKTYKAPSFKFPAKDSTKVPDFQPQNPKPDSSAQASAVADTVPSKPDTPDTLKKIQSTLKPDPQIVFTERYATPKEVTTVVPKDSVDKAQPQEGNSVPKTKLRTNKTLQTYNLNFPFESETWKVNSNKYDWNSLGIQLSWTRYKTEESGYSTLFGLAAGYISGDIKDESFKEKIKFNGLNLNMKLGLGYAPISNELIVAVHFIGEVNAKVAYGSVSTDEKKVNPFAIYADATIGGTFMVGYQVLGSFGFLAGIDITTNAFGIGGYSQELTKASKVKQLHYVFTGVNVTPHIGFFFAF